MVTMPSGSRVRPYSFKLLTTLTAVVLVATSFASFAAAWAGLQAGLGSPDEGVWVPLTAGFAELALAPFLFVTSLRPIAAALAGADFTTRAIIGLTGAAPFVGVFMLLMTATAIVLGAVRWQWRQPAGEAHA